MTTDYVVSSTHVKALFFLPLSSRGGRHTSWQPFGAVGSQQLFSGWCLSAKWKSAETNIDCAQKLQFRNVKGNLTFGTFRPTVFVVGGGRCPKDGRVA